MNQQQVPVTAVEFVNLVVNKFSKREGVFSEFRNVDDYVPQEAEPQVQALFLFYVVQLDYAVRGRVLYPGATSLFEANSKFFDINYIKKISNEELLKILTTYMKPRYPNEAVIRYKINSDKLNDLYGGDPLKIFSDSKTAQEALDKIQEFRGMGPKTGNLFFRSMVSYFNFHFDDLESVLPPVDIHDVRIANLMGYVDSNEMTEKNINNVKAIWNNAAKEAGVNWMIFDKALWLLGSEGKPKNKSDILALLK